MKTNFTCFSNFFFKYRLVYTNSLQDLNPILWGAMPNAITSVSTLPINSEKAHESANDHKLYAIPICK